MNYATYVRQVQTIFALDKTAHGNEIVETNNLDKFVIAITTAKNYNVSRLIAGRFYIRSR